MKSLKSLILAVTLLAAPLFAQNGSYSNGTGIQLGRVDVQSFAQWSTVIQNTIASGSQWRI